MDQFTRKIYNCARAILVFFMFGCLFSPALSADTADTGGDTPGPAGPGGGGGAGGGGGGGGGGG
ncbi:MAG: hypothetical protein LBT33_01270, partial [Spirochaetia bacterium]|nr:hypothetical protein [Spirochaetia bacterium]